MNHEETRFAAKVMSAWADGKTVQARDKHSNNSWFDCRSDDSDSMAWDWSEMDYRIKPEPRVIYVNAYDDNLSNTHHMSESAARLNATSFNRVHRVLKFIEVIE